MRRPGSIRVFYFRGVDLFVHVSLLFLLAYVVLISAFQFPLILKRTGIDPALLIGGPWIWGVVFALGLFVSVALHEFGHALTAQAMGIRVKGITLMMLGGVSEMETIPEKNLAEFKLSVVGPLVSLVLALGLGWGANHTGSANLAFFCYWMGSVNLMLAIFNMIPAFPLDGGRALRSLLASRMGFIRATRTSVRTSQFLAWGLGFLGLFSLNFLLVMIAVFIYASAQTELLMVLARAALRGMKAGEVAVTVQAIPGEATLRDAASRMMSARLPVLPVQTPTLEGLPSGAIITLRQISAVPKKEWANRKVQEIAERPERIIDSNEPLASVIRELAGSPVKALPVSLDGAIVGVIRYSDLSDLLELKGLQQTEEDRSDQPKAA